MIARLPTLLNMYDKICSLIHRESFDIAQLNTVRERCKCLEINDEKLTVVMQRMGESFAEGLHPDTAAKAAVKMLPTYIRATSVGQERGKYLALDLGGSKFRVLLIELDGYKSQMKHTTYDLPDHIQKGTGTQLFDHIADCLARFMNEQKIDAKEKTPLGFTFSFPCAQDELTSARLVNWTKGFNASGVVGEDVVRLLGEACERRKINIDVVAVINDTTGTMLACSFFEQHCYIGLIVGTGSNACYMERLEKIPKLKKINPTEDGLPAEMCINCEWGAFGDDGKLDDLRTSYDRALDKQTINQGKQLFEKMISGLYLGELVRLVLGDLMHDRLLFRELQPTLRPESFTSRLLSAIEREVIEDSDKPLSKIAAMLKEIGVQTASSTDCVIVAYICSLISSRSAHLCAAGIAALLNRMERPYVAIGVDGTVYRVHPTFKDLLAVKIFKLIDGKYKFKLVLSEDGSGRGAAVAAAVAKRIRDGNKNEGDSDEANSGHGCVII